MKEILIETAGKPPEPFQPPETTSGVMRRHLAGGEADGRETRTPLLVSATALQIANDIPWFGMMKCQHAGDGSARCSVYGFGELASTINNPKKTATDCLPLLAPDRN